MALKQRIACLSIDMEPDLRCPNQRIRLLEDEHRLEEFVRILRRYGVPLTSFTVMSHAKRYIERLNALAREIPVEFAVHSFSHDNANPASVFEIARARDAYESLWNAAPLGYRAPNCVIDAAVINRLTRAGFQYDSSIVPSIRPDAYGYNNLRFGREPFYFYGDAGRLLELPIACLARIHVPLIFSYVKLLGLSAYRLASALFPLPDVVVTYFHPYDLYASEIADNIPGWKRYAHARNGRNGMTLLLRLIELLKKNGYEFALMRDVAESFDKNGSALKEVALAAAG